MISDFSKALVYDEDSGFQGVVKDNGVKVFYGISYAKPPVGEKRFEYPEKIEMHRGILNATTPGAISWQWEEGLEGLEEWQQSKGPMSEDCLYLNIFTPAKSKADLLPVLFWIHGGASIAGSGSDPILDGTELANRGIIVVTFNYRLGALGFLAHPELSRVNKRKISRNYGVMDMLTALEWVEEHIAVFGGDSNRIIMGGQSAGAGATAYLMTSPLCHNKIRGAIMLSTTPYTYPEIPYSLAYYEDQGQRYMDAVGVHTLQELKQVSVERWVHNKECMLNGHFSFARDNYIFRDGLKESFHNGNYERVPILMGMTRDEFHCNLKPDDRIDAEQFLIRIKEKFGEEGEKLIEQCPTLDQKETVKLLKLLIGGEYTMAEAIHTAKDIEKYQEDVFLYRFDRKVPRKDAEFYGAMHGDDLPYLFGTLSQIPYHWQEIDKEISNLLMEYITNFVKVGNPNGKGMPRWPAYCQGEEVMLFGAEGSDKLVGASVLPNKERIELIEKIRQL